VNSREKKETSKGKRPNKKLEKKKKNSIVPVAIDQKHKTPRDKDRNDRGGKKGGPSVLYRLRKFTQTHQVKEKKRGVTKEDENFGRDIGRGYSSGGGNYQRKREDQKKKE